MEWNTIFSVLDKGGVLALLILILFSGVRKWWVFGWVYREEKERSAEWKDLALSGTRIAEHMASRRRDSSDGPSTS